MSKVTQHDVRQWLLTLVAVGIIIYWAINPAKVNALLLGGVLSMLGLGIVLPKKGGGHDSDGGSSQGVGQPHSQGEVGRSGLRDPGPDHPSGGRYLQVANL